MTLGRELTEYEVEVIAALKVRRDTVERLRDVLNVDLDRYEHYKAAIEGGDAMSVLEPSNSGAIRQEVSDVVIDFEAARHRFRLALVAVAVDNGMNAREIGESFAFSRQLASRYLKEARGRWPALVAREAETAAVRLRGHQRALADQGERSSGSDASRGVFAY